MVAGIGRRSTSNSSEFQLLPRSPLDWRLGPVGAARAVSTSSGENAAGLSVVATASGGPAGGVIDIEFVAGHLGLDVTVVGLVTATGDGEVTINDGTGEVRIGGPSAAAALSLLEPGDAVEVRGRVTQDERGLLILADAASIVTLPLTSTASPGSSSDNAAAALGPPIRTSPVPSLIVTSPSPVAVTRPTTVTSSPRWPATNSMSITPPAGPPEAVATTARPATFSPDAVETALAAPTGPSRQSSGERGSSWNSAEFEVDRRTMPATMANRPTEDDVIDIPAAGSPRTTTSWPFTSTSTRQREPACCLL